jgi:hypothetical protein
MKQRTLLGSYVGVSAPRYGPRTHPCGRCGILLNHPYGEPKREFCRDCRRVDPVMTGRSK